MRRFTESTWHRVSPGLTVAAVTVSTSPLPVMCPQAPLKPDWILPLPGPSDEPSPRICLGPSLSSDHRDLQCHPHVTLGISSVQTGLLRSRKVLMEPTSLPAQVSVADVCSDSSWVSFKPTVLTPGAGHDRPCDPLLAALGHWTSGNNRLSVCSCFIC